jgi:single-strand DNA-binding protein
MASFTINRVVLVGRLTHDPELRALPSGTSVCGLRVACNSTTKSADGDYGEKPNYFDVNTYGGAAESVSRYLRKGSRVAIDGRLDWRAWETPDGQRRQAVRVVADTVQFLDNPGGQRRELGLDAGFDGDHGPAGEYDGGDLGSIGEYGDYEQDRELAGVGAGSEEAELVF